MPIVKPAIYCPGRDAEFEGLSARMIECVPGMHPETLWGGDKSLDALAPKARLYLMCHSHYEMSVFEAAEQIWTPKQLAALMESDGLDKGLQALEMMVCKAGVALNSKKSQQELLELKAEYDNAKKSEDPNPNAKAKRIEKAQKAYNAAAKKALKAAPYSNKNQALPLSCELMDELKKRGYKDLRITAYKVPVAFIFVNGEVTLNLETANGYGVPVSDARCQAQKVIWL